MSAKRESLTVSKCLKIIKRVGNFFIFWGKRIKSGEAENFKNSALWENIFSDLKIISLLKYTNNFVKITLNNLYLLCFYAFLHNMWYFDANFVLLLCEILLNRVRKLSYWFACEGDQNEENQRGTNPLEHICLLLEQ